MWNKLRNRYTKRQELCPLGKNWVTGQKSLEAGCESGSLGFLPALLWAPWSSILHDLTMP